MINSNQEKILPLSIPPFAESPNDAYINSALMCYEECEPWFCRNFIMLYISYLKENKFFDIKYYEYSTFIQWTHCFWLRIQRIKRDYILDKWGSFTDFVKYMIDDGYYVCFLVNAYYIEPALGYKEYVYYHPMLIYGYDTKNKIFNIADFIFNRSGSFSIAKTSMKSIELAFRDIDKNKILSFYSDQELDEKVKLFRVDFNRYNECRNINISFLKQQLEDFLNSTPIDSYWWSGKELEKFGSRFGLEVYNIVLDNLYDLISNFNPRRSFYTIYAHKEAMIYRLRILSKHNLLGNNHQIINKYSNINDTAKQFLSLFIKYKIKQNINLIERMKEKIIYIRDHEKDVIKEILENLK